MSPDQIKKELEESKKLVCQAQMFRQQVAEKVLPQTQKFIEKNSE